MDCSPRFLPSANYERQRVLRGRRTKSKIDRFSDLPEEVALHILSFLAITNLVRLSCVSKRCREFCLSSLSLNFDIFACWIHLYTANRRSKLLGSLNRFLNRRGVNKIQRFRIYWDDSELTNPENFCTEEEKLGVIRWIHNAVRCNVEVLQLEFCLYKQILTLPSCVFLCRSLRSLLFVGERTAGCKILKAPSLDSFSNLEYLKLKYVVIEDEGIFKWISCCCKCINELHLQDVRGINNVIIESSSLKLFCFKDSYDHHCNVSISGEKLQDMDVECGYFSRRKLLNIFVPNLKYLKWRGNWSIQQNLGKMMSVEKAELFLMPEAADELNIVFEVLCSISRVEVLVLNKATTMAMLNGGSMPAPLENVSSLCIHIRSWLDILVPEMVSLFGGMPKLSTLDIESDSLFLDPKTDCSGFTMGYWMLQNLAFVDQLKVVTIELSNGSNAIEFARYILEHAQNLKAMVIVRSPQQSNAMRKLKKGKMTSNATVVFEGDQKRGTPRQISWSRNLYWRV